MKNVVNNWMMQAESDLDSAKYNFKGRKLDVAAYLCQQSVEKGLKAAYLKKTNELWKTHDLVKLGTLINAPERIIKICNDLNPIYVEDRYPDFSDIIPAKKFADKDVKEYLRKAERAIKWIKTQLK